MRQRCLWVSTSRPPAGGRLSPATCMPAASASVLLYSTLNDFYILVAVLLQGSYGFVRYKNHQDAVRAIGGMNGQVRSARVVWC